MERLVHGKKFRLASTMLYNSLVNQTFTRDPDGQREWSGDILCSLVFSTFL